MHPSLIAVPLYTSEGYWQPTNQQGHFQHRLKLKTSDQQMQMHQWAQDAEHAHLHRNPSQARQSQDHRPPSQARRMELKGHWCNHGRQPLLRAQCKVAPTEHAACFSPENLPLPEERAVQKGA